MISEFDSSRNMVDDEKLMFKMMDRKLFSDLKNDKVSSNENKPSKMEPSSRFLMMLALKMNQIKDTKSGLANGPQKTGKPLIESDSILQQYEQMHRKVIDGMYGTETIESILNLHKNILN